YGVLKDVDASRLPLLETSAGDRAPRNIHELRAQAYMVGNCSHCHNPHGFPVRENPLLVDLDFSPGGIVFGFPLGKPSITNPRAKYVDPLALDLSAPEASWIYRRVSTPVTTVWTAKNEDLHLVVPHMPANTPGMDCRAPDLIGRWTASIVVDGLGHEVDGDPDDQQVIVARQAADARVANFTTGCVPPDDVAN